ncbi:MAG TPA: bifunctional DNA primase/helicase [Microvirga sp.]|jgi:hypothetical protein|nr:bifunctional DNA primase/helicase [Microvirga sp.]
MTFHPSGESYARAAFDREVEDLARTMSGRNDRLNRAAFNLGQLIGAGVLNQGEVERRLMSAAQANGYISKDGREAAQATIRSGLSRGITEPRTDIPDLTGRAGRTSTGRLQPRPAPTLQEVPFPDWTPPDDDGKPLFTGAGKREPDLIRGEVRRHIYFRDGEPVRVKVKRGPRGWLDLYRVRRPSDGAIGWQAKRPVGYVHVPYTGPAGALDPFDREHLDEPLLWPEGERDVDTLQKHGSLAFTFGGSSDVPELAEELVAGRDLIICGDNDEPGRKCVSRKVELATRAGAHVRVVSFPELDEGGDVSDWLAQEGASIDFLLLRGEQNRNPAEAEGVADAESAYAFTLFEDIEEAPRKAWMIDDMLGEAELTAWYGAPGCGKSVLAGDAACHVGAGLDWFGRPVTQGAVLYVAAERPRLVERRFAAWRKRHGIHKLPVAVVKGSFNLCTTDVDTARIIATAVELERVTGFPVIWIIVDTKAQVLAGGDENGSRDMMALVANLMRLQNGTRAHVTVVDHVPHMDPNRMRGHGALLGAVDATFRVSKNADHRTLEIDKVNDGPDDVRLGFTLESVTLSIDPDTGKATTAPVVVPTEDDGQSAHGGQDRGPKLSAAEKRALDMLREAIASAGKEAPACDYIPRKARVTSEELWRTYCYQGGISTGDTQDAKRKAFVRSAQTLIAKRKVGKWGEFVWLIEADDVITTGRKRDPDTTGQAGHLSGSVRAGRDRTKRNPPL